MEIAPDFTAADWKTLDLHENEQHWLQAVDVLKRRLYARYIYPVDALIEIENSLEPKQMNFGFTILAVDLLLMETLQAFKEGLADTNRKSQRVFMRFLRDSPRFSPFFSTPKQCNDFYIEFRCGILHQAEIQSTARVCSSGELYDRCSEGDTVNYNAVHQSLKADLEDYLELLRDPHNSSQRALFKKKMNAVADKDVHC
ncbi:hypothetical protein [Psychromonas ossibalaenae]|uniref:hypothetical protein n=1 Tax=Psychromonas ossibalaenae TaxID=444922 RepID=UPI00035E9CB9|nr:hypothetical protein [Psychromonas ossibalaenae]